jgi:hypothetical protein
VPLFLLPLLLAAAVGCGPEIDIGGLMPSGAAGRADLKPEAVHGYLERAEIARPEVVGSVVRALREGRRFRDRVQDQRQRWTLATVWIDPDQPHLLHVDTMRNETCPDCKGTGTKSWNQGLMSNVPFDTNCMTCDGTGILKNHVTERQFLLTAEDFTHPERARRILTTETWGSAPAGARQYVADLASDDAKTRLAACLWLDRNWVRKGEPFQQYLPMLRKARWQERSGEKELMVYQFWAGKELPSETNRAYYRIYIDTGSGRIIEKGFYSAY